MKTGYNFMEWKYQVIESTWEMYHDVLILQINNIIADGKLYKVNR